MGRCKSAQHSVGADDSVSPINIADSPQISEKALLSVGGQSRPPLQWNGQAFADLPKISEKYELPVVHNVCPADKHTKRQEVKELIAALQAQYPDLKTKIFGAMQRLPLPQWGILGGKKQE